MGDGRLDAYEVLAFISKTKFSEVYKARRKEDGTLVALKKIEIFEIMDPEKRAKVLKEADLIKSLDHEHIIRCMEHFIEDNTFTLIFEWCSQGDVKKLIKKSAANNTPIGEATLWSYAMQMASALEYMHVRRVLHRDIKPANIFIAANGALKIGDLGLGREFSSKTMEAFSKVGTPLYMSPEVISGSGYDWKSDVWSLGCLMYELATLRSPFRAEGTNIYGIFKKIKTGDFVALSPKDGHSNDFVAMVHAMLQLDPERRPSMGDVHKMAVRMSERLAAKLAKVDPAIVSENVVEKLKLLGYERDFCARLSLPPFHRVSFSLAAAGRPSPPDGEPDEFESDQFVHVMHLFRWLIELNGGSFAFDVDANGRVGKVAGGSIVTDLVVALKALAIPTGFGAMKLRQAHGDAVCATLNALANMALKKRNWTFDAPSYAETTPVDESALGNEGELDADDESDIDDEAGLLGREEEESSDEEDALNQSRAADISIFASQTLPVLHSQVSPADWSEEVARVAPLLRVVRASEANWFSRIEALCKASASMQAGTPAVAAQLGELQKEIGESLHKFRTREKRLHEALSSHVDVYQARTAQADELRKRQSALADVVTTLTNDLSLVCEDLELVRLDIKNRMDGTVDTGPLTRIKKALAQLRDDVRELDVRTGVTQAQLLAAQRRQQR